MIQSKLGLPNSGLFSARAAEECLTRRGGPMCSRQESFRIQPALSWNSALPLQTLKSLLTNTCSMKSILLLVVGFALALGQASTRADDAANTKAAPQSSVILELEKEREALKEVLKSVKKNHPEAQRRYQRIAQLESLLPAPEDQSNASELARAKQELQKMLLIKKGNASGCSAKAKGD